MVRVLYPIVHLSYPIMRVSYQVHENRLSGLHLSCIRFCVNQVFHLLFIRFSIYCVNPNNLACSCTNKEKPRDLLYLLLIIRLLNIADSYFTVMIFSCHLKLKDWYCYKYDITCKVKVNALFSAHCVVCIISFDPFTWYQTWCRGCTQSGDDPYWFSGHMFRSNHSFEPTVLSTLYILILFSLASDRFNFVSTEQINLNLEPWGAYMFLKHFLFKEALREFRIKYLSSLFCLTDYLLYKMFCSIISKLDIITFCWFKYQNMYRYKSRFALNPNKNV